MLEERQVEERGAPFYFILGTDLLAEAREEPARLLSIGGESASRDGVRGSSVSLVPSSAEADSASGEEAKNQADEHKPESC